MAEWTSADDGPRAVELATLQVGLWVRQECEALALTVGALRYASARVHGRTPASPPPAG